MEMDLETQEYINQLKMKIDNLKDEVEKLNKQLENERIERRSAEFRIETELEPRIRRENIAYDDYISAGAGAEAGEAFEYHVDELIEMAKENPKYFEWDCSDSDYGDIYSMVLCLVNAHIRGDLKYLCIEDKPEQKKTDDIEHSKSSKDEIER